MKKNILLGFVLFFSFPLLAQIKVACIGNSITAGEYPKILQTLLGNTYKVEGWGQSGSKMCFSSNSPWVKLNWPGPAGIKWQQPSIITIKLGTNDAQAGTWPGCKSSFKADYIKFIDSLYKWVKVRPKIYLCLPSPSTDNNGFNIKGSTIKNEIIPIIREIGAQLNLPVIDLNTPLIPFQTQYFPDGVHPNTQGSTEIAKLIHKAITSTVTSSEHPNYEQSFNVSPNPATNAITLNINASRLPTQIILYDAIGNIITSERIESESSVMNLAHLKSGFYFLKLGTTVQKITIVR